MPNNVKGKNGGQGHSIKHHQNHISEKAADTIKGGETVKTGSSAIKSNHSVQDAINTTVQTAESSVRSSSAEGGAAASEATFASQVTRDVPDHITNRISTAENISDAISDHQDRKVFQEKRAIATRSETSIKPTDKTLESFKPETSPFATAPDYRTVTSAADNAYQVKVHQTVIHDSIKSHAGSNTPKQPVSDLSTITHDVAQREQAIKGAAANAPAVKGLSEGPKLKTAGTQHQVLRGVGNGIKAGTTTAAHSASTIIAGASALMGEGDESEKIANAGKIMESQGLSDAHNDLHSVTHQATNRIIKNKVQDHFEKKEGIKTGNGHGVKAKEGVPRVHPDVPGKSAEDVTGSRPANWVSKAREKATAKRETIGNLGKNKKVVDNAAKSVSDAAGGTSVVKSKEITGKAANKKAVEKKTAKAGQNWRLRKANTDNAIAARSGEKIKSAEKKKPKKGEPAKKKAKEAVKKKAVDKKTVKKKPAVSGKAKNAIAGPRNALASPEKLLQRKGPGTVKGRPDLVAIKKKTTKSKKALKTGKAARKVNKNAIKKGSSKAATKKAAETAKRKARHAAEKKVLTQVATAKKAAEAKAAATAAEATAAVASGPVGWVVIATVAVIMVVVIAFIAVFGIFMNKQQNFDGEYFVGFNGECEYMLRGNATEYGPRDWDEILRWHGRTPLTASGLPAQRGLVAVNTKQIPLGSILYVEAADGSGMVYGWCEAADTGIASYSDRIIDLRIEPGDPLYHKWGKRKANVYVVQKGNGHATKDAVKKYLAKHPEQAAHGVSGGTGSTGKYKAFNQNNRPGRYAGWMKMHGCGPCSVATCLTGYGYNITPEKVASENGWTRYIDKNVNSIRKRHITVTRAGGGFNISAAQKHLKSGNPMIVKIMMRSKKGGTVGHFIVLSAASGNKIQVIDSAGGVYSGWHSASNIRSRVNSGNPGGSPIIYYIGPKR